MERTDALVKWATSYGAFIHEHVQIYNDDNYGISLRSLENIQAQSRIVSCPFSLSLSYFNTLEAFPSFKSRSNSGLPNPLSLHEILAPHVDRHVIGHFFLILQYLLGINSFWHPYIASLPQPNEPAKLATPLYYDEDAKAFLINTQVGESSIVREEQWRREWLIGRSRIDDAIEYASWSGKWSWGLYKWAATIFSSRSFVSSLIPNEAYEVDTASIAVIQSIASQKEGPMPVLFPLVDLANHSPAARVTWFSDVRRSPMDLSLLTEVGLEKDRQIFNNYAPKGNSQLLLGYGFMLPDNADLTIAPKAIGNSLEDIQQAWSASRPLAGQNTTSYTLRSKPFPYKESDRLSIFSCLEDGCIDHLVLLMANQRELSIIRSDLDERVETKAESHLRGSLGRNIMAVISTLRDVYDTMLDDVLESGKGLPSPNTPTEHTAFEYRHGQISLLEKSIEPLTALLCSYTIPTAPSALPKLLTLHSAFGTNWSGNVEEEASAQTMKAIIRVVLELESEEEINWSELQEDWEFTIWCFWIFCQTLAARTARAGPVTSWISTIHASGAYTSIKSPEQGFSGERSEWECFQEMIEALNERIRDHGTTMVREEQVSLMIEAGHIVMAETVLIRSVDSNKRFGGAKSTQTSRLFYLP